jgi:hypothetical protein
MTEGGTGSESLPLDRRPARGLPIAGQPGIMGGMAEADSMAVGLRLARRARGRLPMLRLGADRDRGPQTCVRVEFGSLTGIFGRLVAAGPSAPQRAAGVC